MMILSEPQQDRVSSRLVTETISSLSHWKDQGRTLVLGGHGSGLSLWEGNQLSDSSLVGDVIRIKMVSDAVAYFATSTGSVGNLKISPVLKMSKPSIVAETGYRLEDFDISRSSRIACLTNSAVSFYDLHGKVVASKSCTTGGNAQRCKFIDESTVAISSQLVMLEDSRSQAEGLACFAPPGTGGVFTELAAHGKLLAAGSSTGAVLLWDLRNPGKSLMAAQCHTGVVTSLHLSGSKCISSSADSTFVVSNITQTNLHVARREGAIDGGSITAMSVSEDSIAYATDTGALAMTI